MQNLKSIFGQENATARAKIIGIAGCTNTGKSTLAEKLTNLLNENGIRAELIKQDDFYKSKKEVKTKTNAENPSIIFYDYDQIEALNYVQMLQKIRKMTNQMGVIVVEGNMITDLDLFAEIENSIFLTIDKEVCRHRRLQRIYNPPDEIGYFDQVVWPSYLKTLELAKSMDPEEKKIVFIDSTKFIPLNEIIFHFQHQICDQIILSKERIDTSKGIEWIKSHRCGANSVFIGTTRDIFDAKKIKQLEYEAYETMAYHVLLQLCRDVRHKYPTILRIAIHHRLGNVPVGETSVLIATSAAQRKESIAATEWLIDALKEKTPIWKKEVYEDGTCSWKENTKIEKEALWRKF